MGSQEIARGQHTVPKVYLRGFAEEGLVSVQRRSGLIRNVPIKLVTVRNDFYNFTKSDGEESDAVESWMANHIEGPIGEVLERLRAEVPPENEDVPVIAAFVASQLLRTPTTTARLRQIDEHLGPLMLATRAFSSAGIDPAHLAPAVLDRVLRAAQERWAEHRGSATWEPERGSRLRIFLRKTDELTTTLSTWTWSLLNATSPLLITGDAPAVTFQPTSGWGGVLPEGSPVYMPVSPSQMLVGEKFALTAASDRLAPELAILVNRAVAREAYDLIIKRPSDEWPPDVDLAAQRPFLASPTVTWSLSGSEAPTFPKAYPKVSSGKIGDLLDALEAEDIVE